MEALTKRFLVPMMPQQPVKQKVIYPWENTNLYVLCEQLYALAKQTGFLGTFNDFKTHFGAYLQNEDINIDFDFYDGQYVITPLPTVEQVLRTNNTILQDDIVIEAISYHQTSNTSGGYTVTIG